MIENIVNLTNAVIKTATERFSVVLAKSDKYIYFRVVNSDNIRAYIGIMYLKVAFRVNSLTRSTIESHESARDVISITMSEKRFEFISRFIIFDKKNSREERWKSGKFACLRELLEQVNENV